MFNNELKEYLSSVDLSNTKPSIESLIQPQIGDKFVDDLLYLLDNRYDIGKNYFKDEIEELFRKRFNIKVNFIYTNTYASMCVPMVGSVIGDLPRNNYLMRALSEELNISYSELIEEFKKIEHNDIRIDIKNAKIYGYDSKLNYIYIDENMFNKKYPLTSKEIAGIIMHEMGHIFTHIYYTSHIVKNAFNLTESLILYSNGEISKAKEIILTDDDKKADDYKIIFKKQTADLKKMLNKYNGILAGMQGKYTLNKISEIEADEFATKFGLGDALATALTKMMVDDAWLNTGKQIISVAKFIAGLILFVNLITGTIFLLIMNIHLFIVSIFLDTIIVVLIVIIINGFIKFLNMLGVTVDTFRYDKIKQRIERIKRNAIKILRSYKVDKEATKVIVNNIDVIEKALEKIDKSLANSNLGSILLMDTANYGNIDDINALYDVISDRLTNNDFHYLAEKIKKD